MTDDIGGQDEVVILVHGTFATDAADEGARWWQKGSVFYEGLAKRLPDHIRLVGAGEIFRWDGANSETHRIAAAMKLLKVMRAYEAQGTAYHVVAHSHGGSVAWLALFLAGTDMVAQPKRGLKALFKGVPQTPPLPGLRSLTTVGTPFILTRKLSFLEALRTNMYLFASLAALVGVMVLGSGDTPAPDWIVLPVMLNLLLVPFFAFGNLGPKFALHRFNTLQKDTAGLAAANTDRWCGIWAQEDEAIALLRSALTVSKTKANPPQAEVALHPRDLLPDRFLAWGFWLYGAPARLMRRLTRRVYLPFLDQALKTRLASFILGVDDLRTVEAVAPWPHPTMERGSLLPAQVQAEIKAQCDAALAGTSSGARPALRYLSVGAVDEAMQAFGDTNTALIHNCYFDHPAVIDLIAARIKGGA